MTGKTYEINLSNIGAEFAALAVIFQVLYHHNFNALTYEQERIY